MNRIICPLIIMLMLSLLIGCGNDAMMETYQESKIDSENTEKSTTTFTVNLHKWKPYKGYIPTAEGKDLVTVETTEDRCLLHMFNNCYKELELPEDKLELPLVSGWRVNLDDLIIVGKTTAGDIIMTQDDQNPLLACVVSKGSERVRVLLREDISEKGIESFDFSTFDVYYDGHLVEKREIVERIWLFHIQNRSELVESVLLDGEWEYYNLILMHRDCPALQYEINLGVCDDSLYMENLYCKYSIKIPLDQVK